MRLRKAPYTEFRSIHTTLDSFSDIHNSFTLMINNIPVVDIELKQNGLISYMNPACPKCSSRNVVKNGTCARTMENGIKFRIQRYMCKDCSYSFVARPPNYGCGKHYPDDLKEKSIRSRIKTSLRKTADLFHILGNVIISHETIRKYMPEPSHVLLESSGYFVYDEQYTHINGSEKYRALLKDANTGSFVEEMLDDLREETLASFLVNAIKRFKRTDHVIITTDGYRYESALRRVNTTLNMR